MTLPAGDPSTPLVITGSSSDNICLLQPMSTMVYDTEDGDDDNQLSCVDPMGNITATTYDDDNRPVTTSQGQVLPADATFHAAAFENVPQAPGMARTIQVYAPASTTSGYSFTDTAGSLSLSAVDSSAPAFGSGWYYLGYLTLPASDTSSTVTVSHSGSGVTQYALLQQTGATTYNSAGQIVSQIDGLNRVTAAAYDGDTLEQTGTYQGQILTASSGGSATFQNLPQAPGQARTYYVFGTTESRPASP